MSDRRRFDAWLRRRAWPVKVVRGPDLIAPIPFVTPGPRFWRWLDRRVNRAR